MLDDVFDPESRCLDGAHRPVAEDGGKTLGCFFILSIFDHAVECLDDLLRGDRVDVK